MIGRSPAKDPVGAFDQGAAETKALYGRRQAVPENQLGVAEDMGPPAEHPLDQPPMLVDLLGELGRIGEAGEGVMVSLAEDLHPAGVHQILERLQRLRRPGDQLLDQGPRE